MIKPLALELMRCVLSDLPYYTFRTDGLDYIEVLISKDILDKEKVITILSNHPFISGYMEYILVGEIENEYKDYVLISILKNTTNVANQITTKFYSIFHFSSCWFDTYK